ncbi:FAD-binding protein [Mycobacterium hubeiense]|uniref:FAD-binding protein n=1 Tax=Mycobacterium hubeiense TaxID=1867256 RepID=UPI000C7F3829|nr:FAD-binding protein [Mycobacterium sp. QGD 101]
MTWDDEVDVLCVGSGLGGLAGAVAADDAGLDVLVAQPSAPSEGVPSLGAGVTDSDTLDYFAAVTGDAQPPSAAMWNADPPLRVVDALPPDKPRAAVAPFLGARLRDWASCCLASPYGFLHTRVSNRGTTMRTRDGEIVEVAAVGSLPPDTDAVTASELGDWLIAQARDRDVEVFDESPLQRIVFEEGDVVGAVLATPDGPYAVRTHHGVIVTTSDRETDGTAMRTGLAGQGIVEVCLVNKPASRFGRVELVVAGEPVPPAHTLGVAEKCTGMRPSASSDSI